MTGAARAGEVVSLSVHGPAGVLDLQASATASGGDLAAEYARQAGVPVPVLHSRLGRPLAPEVSLADAGVVSGTVLVATPVTEGVRRPRRSGLLGRRDLDPPRPVSGTPTVAWCTAATAAAVVAGWAAAGLPDGSGARTAVVVLLGCGAVLGLVPLGSRRRQRALTAPAYAGAAAWAVARPALDRLPDALGSACAVAGAVAVLAWCLDRDRDEALRVWALASGGVAAVLGLAALGDADPQAGWAVLLVLAALAARWVPAAAVDVPDGHLLGHDGLPTPAWSAHDRPVRPERPVVPRALVARAVQRGARTLLAASVAVLAVVPVAAVLVLDATAVPAGQRDPADLAALWGARAEVVLAGAVLLLASRNQRHRPARRLLRVAGLACWVLVPGVEALVVTPDPATTTVLAAVSVAAGAVVVLVAVAVGRGWRSVRWSRLADLAETAATALLVGSVVLSTGLVAALWTVTG